MKKNGFTLAEVLITLAIIGVVATLTLPALLTNTAEQQAKTALKKGINTLTEAAQMNQAIDGFDYASFTDPSTTNKETQSLYGLLSKRASVDILKSGTGKLESHQGATTNAMKSENYCVFFRDGSVLAYTPTATTDAGDPQDDNLVYGIPVLYDTNGTKGPNILSNCKGAALGASTDTDETSSGSDTGNTTASDCSDNSKRIIKDQFGIRLRGGHAVPNGAASRWAFEN
jgi:prepilin-type N-terminal cleavage/methylation domain-containing protein